jgi:hypothetical protein
MMTKPKTVSPRTRTKIPVQKVTQLGLMASKLHRFKEPSTWRGFAILLGAVGVGIEPAAAEQIGVSLAAAIAAIEIIRKEK